VQLALADFMREQPDYAGTLGAFYQAKRDLFLRALEHSRLTFSPSQGSYFQLLNYSAITTEPDTLVSEQWTRENKIASIPISVFYAAPPQQSTLRFCFAKSDSVLLQAAEILCRI